MAVVALALLALVAGTGAANISTVYISTSATCATPVAARFKTGCDGSHPCKEEKSHVGEYHEEICAAAARIPTGGLLVTLHNSSDCSDAMSEGDWLALNACDVAKKGAREAKKVSATEASISMYANATTCSGTPTHTSHHKTGCSPHETKRDQYVKVSFS